MSECREDAAPDGGAASEPPLRLNAGEQRAAVQQRVRRVRSRLSQGPGLKPEFEYELVCLFARNELSARATLPLLAVALLSTLWAPLLQAGAWLALVVAMKSFMVAACLDFLARPRSEVSVAAWRRRFLWLELATSVTWGSVAVLGVGSADPAGCILLLASLTVLIAMRIFAPVRIVALSAATIPTTLAVVARLVTVGDPLHLALAAVAVGLHACFLLLARDPNATALAMLQCRAETDALIAENEAERAVCAEARRRAEAASAAKSRFLATVSHELRTPLNAILGFSEVMKGELLGPICNGNYKEYAANIHDSGRHLLQLINEILDLSRIEVGRYDLKEEPVSLTSVVEHCLRLLKLRAESKGLRVVLVCGTGLGRLWADERAMRQVCLNLICNALKFTPRGGCVTVTVGIAPDGGQLLVVKDTGPGIPKEEIPRVMQAFGQGSLAHRTAEGGTGLGLSIVQNLVGLHGGTFELRSVLRKGTEAIVRLPPSRVVPDGHPRVAEALGGKHPSWWRSHTSRSVETAASTR
jgi:two-component system cell cycle sensor histidine kinase PleC